MIFWSLIQTVLKSAASGRGCGLVCSRRVGRWLPLGLVTGLPQLLRGENQVAYRYEYYSEDSDRMKVETHSVYFEQQLIDSITAKGELTYDGVSGATPVGTVYPNGKIALTHMDDVRRAVSTEFDCRLANHTLTPGFAYSYESDYTSYGVSLNDAITFNEKNTTLQLGVSHNFDSVRLANEVDWDNKQSTMGMIGITQLLTPNDILNVAFTYGNDSGYLSDPYRLANYLPTGFPFSIGVPERRPSHRNKQIVYTSWTHYFDQLHASLEGSYRFYYDSFGVTANTVALTWHQWLGQHLILEPTFRFYEQTSADFYQVTFNGPYSANPPGMHSSDYRLSEFYSLYYGLQATVVVNDHVHLVAGYHRYDMEPMNGSTPSAMYPRANIYTAGLTILW